MNKVKILFADHVPFAGGAQLRLADDLKFLNREKIDPLLVIDKGSRFEAIFKDSALPIYKTAFPKLNIVHPIAIARLLGSVKAFHQLVTKLKPDVVMANTTRTLLVAAVSIKIFGGEYKLISYIRDYDYPQWMMKWIDQEVDKYLFVSESVRDFYKLSGEVIYLGSNIENQLKKITLKKVKEYRTQLGINLDDYVIGYLGRLVDWKGGEEVIKAYQKLNRKNSKLVFWGTGKGQNGSNETKLKQFVSKNNLRQEVIFAGHIEDPALALKLMNCLILSSKKPEPFATTVIEAAFANVPIVATDKGGTGEFVKHQKNGLLTTVHTNQMSQALLRLIDDPKLGQKLAEKAYKNVQKFSQENFIKKFEKALLT